MDAVSRFGFPALAVLSAGAAFYFGSTGAEAARLFAWIAAALSVCGAGIVSSPRLGTAVTAALCAAANGYLLYDKVAASGKPALCTIDEVINCSAVNSSPYSELAGVPVTLLGLAFYLGLGVTALFGPQATPRFHQVNGLFAMGSLAFSAYLANASYQMGLVCPFCLSIYAGNVLLAWAAIRGLAETKQELFTDLGGVPMTRSFQAISAMFVVIVGVGISALPPKAGALPGGGGGAKATPADFAKLYEAVVGEVTVDGSEPILGNPSGAYQIVEFADFGCPHCAHAAVDLKELVKMSPDVGVRFRVFPLSGECNPKLDPGDPRRCIAAAAAECAHRQGRFWEFSEAVFTNQTHLELADMQFHAKDLGLDVAAFDACVMDPATLQAVVADANAGAAANVRGTPAFFLKGTHGDQWISITQGPEALMRVIEAHRDGMVLPPPAR